ncbi:MAG: acyltransferase family protein [Acidimicrobiia bacterium]
MQDGDQHGDRRRVPQLDGLRGVAILLVVFAHMWDGVSPTNRRLFENTPFVSGGGLFGVELFFVLSGFLITSLLLREQEETGTVRMGGFYLRRARRLLPAFAIVLAAYGTYALVVYHGDARTAALGSIARAATYTENLQSAIGWPSDRALGHTWSLAVEEQFYLLWPAVLLLAARRGRRAVTYAAIAVIGLTVVSRPALRLAGVDLGSGMHWVALMLGSLLAARPVAVPRWLGRAAFAVLGASLLFLPTADLVAYTVAVAAGAVALCHAFRTRWLAHPVLRFFGTISYGLYLWHAFLLWFGWPVLPTVALSIAIATASFYAVERRFLRRPPRVTDAPADPAGDTTDPLARPLPNVGARPATA